MTVENTLPVLLLTGYLGSGKTTLVNRILNNRKGIRFAVIVNDLGEVNIDADLIQMGGVVGQTDESLVALQNGCICCTLKMDLVEQLSELCAAGRFDYIVIEASGICEPAPIAQTICTIPALGPQYLKGGTVPKLDCIVTVVDAVRMQSEFACGDTLVVKSYDDEDLERLVVEQIEFCNIVLLNKASSVRPEELGKIRSIVRNLQPNAEILECDYGDVELEKILDTGLFDFDKVSTSAAWIEAIEGEEHEMENEEEGEADEYGISTYVYFARPALDINKFDRFVGKVWPRNIIRAKGLCYFSDQKDKCYLFEQVGVQRVLRDAGLWYATMPEEQLRLVIKSNPALLKDWDPIYGDRMIKIVFIGQNMDTEMIEREMDFCLDE